MSNSRCTPDRSCCATCAAVGNQGKAAASAGWRSRFSRLSIPAGAAVFISALLIRVPFWLEFGLFLTSYFFIGSGVVKNAFQNILKGHVFDENLLMSIASISAFAIGEFPEGAAVMLFYRVGELLQDIAVNRSRASISSLMDIRPDFANIKAGDTLRRVAPEEVAVGGLILVKPGEKVPLDGKVVDGVSSVDVSALTGESLPADVSPGSEVLSGAVNRNGTLTIEVMKTFGESTVSKILNLVQNAASKKAPTESFITKFSRYYTPFVVCAALALALLPPLIITGAVFSDWIHRALVFLVVSCPCALVISVPLSFFGGIGGASKNGILIKGGNYLEALNSVDTVVFDKTGTLTKGVFKVSEVISAGNYAEKDILMYAAYAESFSNHPIAVSIREAYAGGIDMRRINGHEEMPGMGVRAGVDKKTVLAGNTKLLDSKNIVYKQADALGTVVYIAIDGKFEGHIVISDQIRPDSRKAVLDLKDMGIRNIAMLTGDHKATGEALARELGIGSVYAEMLPHQKVEQLEYISNTKTTKGSLVFVGDGINDAPVLARADVGVAMGGIGSDAAIEAADVVLMTDEPSKLVKAIRVARRTHRIVWQNILLALGIKAVILVLGALGIATMWEAVFGDVGVAVLATLNAMRAMRMQA